MGCRPDWFGRVVQVASGSHRSRDAASLSQALPSYETECHRFKSCRARSLQPAADRVKIWATVTNFVFGMLIGLFIVVALVVAGLVVLDDLLSEAGVLIPPLA